MVLILTTLAQDIPYTYAKFNLGFAVLDVILFWLWGYSVTNVLAWFLFIFAIIRVGNGYVLFTGVRERSVFKCKCFCVGEVILITLEIIFVFVKIASIGHIIWTLIIIALRGYGIWIIGGFIRKRESDLGLPTTLPWTFFSEPTLTQNSQLPGATHI